MEQTDSHKGPHKHGVVAVLQDDAGRLLLIRRGLNLTRAPGWWCLVGGEVEAGEDLATAIKRELREEAGLEAEVRGKVHESVSPTGEYLLHWMEVQLTPAIQPLCPHPEEVAEARWLTPQEALELQPILPGLKEWLLSRTG